MQRFSSVDVHVMARELNEKLRGLRVTKVFSLNPQTVLLRFQAPEQRLELLIEAGVRVHTTAFDREKPPAPNPFAMKLRKALLGKRCAHVRQLGVDRVLELAVGEPGDFRRYLFVELYARGNIVLCDPNFVALAVRRTFRDESTGVEVAVGSAYETSKARPFVKIDEAYMRDVIEPAILAAPTVGKSAPSLKAIITRSVDLGPTVVEHCLRLAGLRPNTKCSNYVSAQHLGPLSDAFLCVQAHLLHSEEDAGEEEEQAGKEQSASESVADQRKRQEASETESAISSSAPRAAFTHGYIIQRGNGQVTVAKRGVASLAAAAAAAAATATDSGVVPPSASATPSAASSSSSPSPASDSAVATSNDQDSTVASEAAQAARESVLSAVSGSTTAATDLGGGVVYDAVVPMLYKQYEGRAALEFSSFDEAVDEFFSRLEGQRLEGRQQTAETKVMRKLDKMVSNQHQRVERFAAEEALLTRKAERIEERVDDVERAITIIQSALSSGLDWNELAEIVREEKLNGDRIANLIHKLKLSTNEIQLRLGPSDLDAPPSPFFADDSDTVSEEDDEDAQAESDILLIDIDIGLSAYANARNYYERRKLAAHKRERTKETTQKARKTAEQKAAAKLKQVRSGAQKTGVQHARKPMWCEKFDWFITSDNLIVICGRDAQQNDLVVKRYLKPGDIYVHADVHGAGSCVIKNPQQQPVPPASLQEAGAFAICRSAAWENKVVTSAFWVYHHQVSKTAPTGEYLPTGSFMIRGKKNFLPPVQLIMALGFLYKLHPDSLQRRLRKQGLLASIGDAVDELDSTNNDSVHDTSLPAAATAALATAVGKEASEQDGNVAAKLKTAVKEKPAQDTETSVNTEDGEEDDAEDGTDSEEDDEDNEDDEDDENDENEEEEEEEEDADEEDDHNEVDDQDGAQSAATTSSGKSSSANASTVVGTALRRSLFDWGAASKYDLDLVTQEDMLEGMQVDEAAVAAEKKSLRKKQKAERKKLSAHERRMLKRGLDPNQPSSPPPPQQQQRRSSAADERAGPKMKATAAVSNKGKTGKRVDTTAPKRRQKAKKKKMLTKYKDQDEEERRLKMEALASAGNSAEQQEEEEAAADAAAADRKTSDPDAAEASTGTSDEKEELRRAVNPGERAARRREKREQELNEARERELAATVEEAYQVSASELSALTAAPEPDDVLLYAVPVCGPYAALQNYRHHVKLVPGKMKRGQVAKACMAELNKMPNITPAQKACLRAVPDDQMHPILVNARVVTAGNNANSASGSKKGGRTAKKKGGKAKGGKRRRN